MGPRGEISTGVLGSRVVTGQAGTQFASKEARHAKSFAKTAFESGDAVAELSELSENAN
jgi:hypothetical protein